MDSVAAKRTTHGSVEKFKLSVKLLLMVVFLGYIMIWIMMPTNTFWIHWLPDIQAKADCTFFGQQGANILIHTLPVLLMATLSCLYLHLEKKYGNHKSRRYLIYAMIYSSVLYNTNLFSTSNFLSSLVKYSSSEFSPALWRRPAIVKGPLGILSWTELSFLFMFIALFVWSFSAYLHGMFANITRYSATQKMQQRVWEVKLDNAALILGLVGNICLAFLFFPVTRASSIMQLVGLTSESSIKYHIWLGHTVMTLFTAHGLCYIIFWAETHQISDMLKWGKVGVSNVAGEVALLSGLAMWLTSFPCIRRKIFELFLYTHYLYVIFIVFFVLHVGFSYSFITLPGFYLFLIDRYLRFLQSQQKVRLVSARILPCQAVELNFSKSPGLTYNPTSIVFVNVPSVSKLQWHPFTITSNSNMEPEKLSIVIKTEGTWSHKLYTKFSSPSPVNYLEVSLEGPYGPASTHFLRHDMLVMVSGGSGITPYVSILRELIFIAGTRSSKISSILLITAFKRNVDLSLLDLILPASGITHDLSGLQLKIEAYITRENEPTTGSQKFHQTTWFKPNALDTPVYAILGSNNWAWLGSIILSSFVIFILLIGILTQYYIYPIDHNTNTIYSQSSRSALSMLFICMSIAITATIAFLWNKKNNAAEMRQIQNTDKPTPMTSPGPGSWYYNADRELESLPEQSLFEAIKVNYGVRPDLKKILLDSKGSSIGVLVSGPKKMRQDVAAICSSGLAKNIHFESISFTW